MKYSELAKKLETATSETRNLIVRPFRNSDEDGLLELFRDQNTMRMDGDTPILEKNDEFIRRINLIKEGPLIWFFSEEKNSSDYEKSIHNNGATTIMTHNANAKVLCVLFFFQSNL